MNYKQNTKYEDIVNGEGGEASAEPAQQVDAKGGGNKYSLPFGLCKGVGIDTTGMTPREAWDAYTNKTGISKEQAEKEHWGKEESAKNVEPPKQEAKNGLKNGDTITVNGKPAKVIEAKNEKGETVVEMEDGQRYVRREGSRFFFKQKEEQPQKVVEEPVQDTAQIETPSQEENGRPKFQSKLSQINEDAARRSKEATSFFEYKSGSATAGYNSDVARFDKNVNDLIERYKNNDTLTQEDWDRVYALADKYASNRASFTNEYNRINSSYPSWFIAGPANYNTRKNERKMNAIDNVMRNQGANIDPDKNEYLTKIQAILSNRSVKSNDSNAVAKLQAKYDGLKAELERGKEMNAYFRKNKTLVGFPGVSDKVANEFDARNRSGDYFAMQPFPAYRLQNGNAELRRLQGRIDSLNSIKEAATSGEDTSAKYPTAEGVSVQENAEQMRVQLRFDGKPDEETRTLLKSYGFRWSPSQNAWQRQLTGNGKYAAKQVMQKLSGKGEQ